MTAVRDFHLDRVQLDGVVVRRRSATVHFGGGEYPETRASPYWVYLGCGRIPERLGISPRPVRLQATTVTGRSVRADVRIVSRTDDAYGTTLILAGVDPLNED